MEIQCSVNPSNLIEPVKVNNKYVLQDKNLNKSFKDTAYYEELSKFNDEMLRELNYSRSNYIERKDKSYENYDYMKNVYKKKQKMLFDSESKYTENDIIKPLIPQRSYFICELNKKTY